MSFPMKGYRKSFAITRAKRAFRNLEREIGSCCRKLARKFVTENVAEDFKEIVDAARVRDMLGPISSGNR